jgi:hypothetical protein
MDAKMKKQKNKMRTIKSPEVNNLEIWREIKSIKNLLQG